MFDLHRDVFSCFRSLVDIFDFWENEDGLASRRSMGFQGLRSVEIQLGNEDMLR